MVIYADIFPAGWILRSAVNFSYLYHLIKGMRPKICGNWVLLIYLKIPTSLLEDYSLDIGKRMFYKTSDLRTLLDVRKTRVNEHTLNMRTRFMR